MKRYLWHITQMNRKGETLGTSCSDAARVVSDAIRRNATSIMLQRGKEIKGKLPTLASMRGILDLVNEKIRTKIKCGSIKNFKAATTSPAELAAIFSTEPAKSLLRKPLQIKRFGQSKKK